MLPIVALPRRRRQGQRSCKRRRRRPRGTRRWDGVAACRTRRLFPWSYRALFIRELGVREDQTARVPLELRRMTWLSPQQVLARCLAPDIEALTPVPAFQRSYLSDQHAALVPRGVCRQQCPHPCFLPAATGADSAIFCGLSDARATRRPGSAACSTGNVIRVIEEWLSRAPPPQRLAQLQRETTPARAGRGLRAEIHA